MGQQAKEHINVVWEYVEDPDAREYVMRAFETILRAAEVGPEGGAKDGASDARLTL